MPTTNVYLNFDGNCEEAFNFYKSVFGIEFSHISRLSDMPGNDDQQLPDSAKNQIMHVALNIGSSLLMGSDCGPEWSPNYQQGNNFSISVSADSKDEADQLFASLSEGAKITMPLENTFWGDYFGMLTDRFGVNWMVGYNEEENKNS